MASFKNIRDVDLHAYVDGNLSAGEIERIEKYLDGHPEKQAMVDDWKAQIKAIGDVDKLLGVDLDEPLPRRLQPSILAQKSPSRASSSFILAAASVAMFVVGGFFGFYAQNFGGGPLPGTPTLTDYAFSAHRIYAIEVNRPVEVGAENQEQLVGWLSKRLGEEIEIPDLSASGFMLVGGRLLPSGEEPAAQFMYENEAGERLTLYTKINKTDDRTQFQLATFDQLKAYFWQGSELGFAVVGDVPQQELKSLAIKVQDQMI